MVNIALNGFGRIGRLFLRRVTDVKKFKVVAVNDLGDPQDLAYLCKYDSVYHTWNAKVEYSTGHLLVNGKAINFFQEKDPSKLPWKKLDVDVVIEATGAFESYESSKIHLDSGAKRVILTAPARDEDGLYGRTMLIGVNDTENSHVAITSNGSCTTNSAAPIIQILDEAIGIEKAVLSTVHGYTATQNLVDGIVKGHDYRRGRAAAHNIVPSTTGAAIAVSRALPQLKDKFDGLAFRVPVIGGSLSDITFIAKRKTSVSEVNDALARASESKRWQGVFKVTSDQLVSSDILGEPYGAIADLSFTKVVDGNLVKVLSWYDNEMGYVSTLVRHLERVADDL